MDDMRDMARTANEMLADMAKVKVGTSICKHGWADCAPCHYERGLAEGARRERERVRAKPLDEDLGCLLRSAAFATMMTPQSTLGWPALLAAITEGE